MNNKRRGPIVRLFRGPFVIAGLLLGLLTWSGAPVAPVRAQSSPAPQLHDVTLVLDWYPNAVHAFVLAAEEYGFFAEEGLRVELKMPAENPTDGVKLVGAGRETFALYYGHEVLLARNEGIPIVSVAAIVRRSQDGIMTLTGSGIASPAELEGKRVGYPSVTLNIHMVETMVRAAGGNPDRVHFIDVAWDLMPALATRRVDAIIGAYVNHEQPLLEKEGFPITYFAPIDYGVPNYYEIVLITAENRVQTEPELVQSMVRSLSKGFKWVKNNPGAALDLLLAKQDSSFPLDEEVERQSLAMLLPWMTPFGIQHEEDWNDVAAWMKSEGLIDAALDSTEAWVPLSVK